MSWWGDVDLDDATEKIEVLEKRLGDAQALLLRLVYAKTQTQVQHLQKDAHDLLDRMAKEGCIKH